MSRNASIYTERKEGFRTEAMDLLHELRSALSIESLRGLRLVKRYEVSGVDEAELMDAARGLLYEAPSDHVLEHPGDLAISGLLIARQYLPGQFDQRADSAARGLRLQYAGRSIAVRCSELIVLEGDLSDEDEERVRDWVINPVDSRPCDPFSSTLGEDAPEPDMVPILEGFMSLDEEGLEQLKADRGIALAPADIAFIRDWFTGKEKRDPTLAELKALDTYWSDHCRHTTFETELTDIRIADGPLAEEIREALDQWEDARSAAGRGEKPRTLMDLATIAGREARREGLADDWDVSEEINACTLSVDARINGRTEKWLLSFKNETHNHPTEIEPYGGASTCLGGAIRDPLSGRAYVHQALRISGGADPRQDPAAARPGKLPQRLIAHGAAEGYAGYGNQIGLATAVVREFYHPGYEAKRLECGAVMGASPADNVIREVPETGDLVILVGGRTGRDGIGGATGSSVAHDGSSLEKAGAEVQKGNPPEERKLQRLFRNPEASRLIRRCNDFGAGGVAVAVGELADGLEIDLDAVPVKYDGLDGLELALSESQERMAVVVNPADAGTFIVLAEKENLEAVIVARVTDDRRLRMKWRGDTVISLDRDLLDTNGVRRRGSAVIAGDRDMIGDAGVSSSESGLTADRLVEVLAGPEVASRAGLEERFDGTVGGGTVLASHGGSLRLTPAEASIHLLPADGDVETAGIMTVGFDPALAEASPFRGGQMALVEALAKMTAAGGTWRKARFSLQEFFGRTDRGEESWGRPLSALLGALTVQRRFGLPAIGGKDSMSGSYGEMDVPPTIIAFAAAAMDASSAVGAAIPGSGLTIALVGPTGPGTPDFDGLAAAWDLVDGINGDGHLKAGASVGRGGWAAKLALMCLGSGFGARIEPGAAGPWSADYGRLIIAANLAGTDLMDRAEAAGAACSILGESTEEPELRWTGGSLALEDALKAWTGTFSEVWPVDNSPEAEEPPMPAAAGDHPKPERRTSAIARPRVCLPVFPGTNGEDDARRAFARAGALPEELVFLDRRPEELDSALKTFADGIRGSQILYISGGFSAGDEPDGAAKYIAAILRQDRVADAISDLLDRDGLVLGICNGFQALLKSGWLETGTADVPSDDSPTLAHNRIGRHVNRVVYTAATGAASPWLSKISRGEVHSIPVSHGEGRFTAPPEVLAQLAAEGRIAFQYCDIDGRPSMAGEWNPNGSDMAVEGLLSPCGRILGKMGHSERWRRGTLINVPGTEREQPLIPGGVEWFL